MSRLVIFLLAAGMCFGQQQMTPPAGTESEAVPAKKIVATVPAGTRVLLTLLSPISSGAAKAGNGVYMQTVTPITAGNETVIPPGSFVQGEVDRVERPGKVKGRAELQIHFTSVTFPSGYHQGG
jgi:type IV secretion system protein VirB10